MSLRLRPADVAVAAAALLASPAAARAPDLQGVWTNTTLTRLERPAAYGDRRAMPAEDVTRLEGAEARVATLARAPTAASATVKDLPADCTGGRGSACNYNAGWTDSGDRVMRVGGEARTSLVTTPADGRIPYRPEVRARLDALPRGGTAQPGAEPPERPGASDNPENRSLGERCILAFGYSGGPVMLPSLYNNTYQIVQTPEEVVVVVEMVHDVRHIRLNARHRTDGVRPWLGDSIGWWEGSTLVVETVGYHRSQSFLGASADHLKVTERFTRSGPKRLLYRFTVENPNAFTQPWGGEYEFSPANGPVYEYACHEGNYGLRSILAGVRERERTPAEGRPGG